MTVTIVRISLEVAGMMVQSRIPHIGLGAYSANTAIVEHRLLHRLQKSWQAEDWHHWS